jgi:LysM repeat protein
MKPSNYRTKLRLFILCLCACGLLLTLVPAGKAQAQNGDRIHIVQPGETLGTIAAKYGISYQQLARHNGISNPNLVRVGQRVRIPSSNSTAPAPAPRPSTAPLPEKVTPVQPPPTTPAPAPPARTCRGELSYSVRGGDSLHRIAASYGVTVSALMARNNLPSSLIVVGQRLIIPANC